MHKLEDLLFPSSDSIREAMKRLDQIAQKVLFIIESNGRLFGTLTDGDIRRWILSGGGLERSAGECCFKAPLTMEIGASVDSVKDAMLRRRISVVPVLDEAGRVADILAWDKIFGPHVERKARAKLEHSVVIMAGGQGPGSTRLRRSYRSH
jgi:CBS domain-containing protein